jgi:hypothetical protein
MRRFSLGSSGYKVGLSGSVNEARTDSRGIRALRPLFGVAGKDGEQKKHQRNMMLGKGVGIAGTSILRKDLVCRVPGGGRANYRCLFAVVRPANKCPSKSSMGWPRDRFERWAEANM